MERRVFVKKSGIACLGGLIGGGLVSSCASVHYANHSVEANVIKVDKSEFLEGRGYVLIKNNKLPAPIYLLKEEGGFKAILLLCTHKACEVTPFGQELHCPCHGSEFNNKGEVLTGPAEEDLKKFRVETNDQYIFIS